MMKVWIAVIGIFLSGFCFAEETIRLTNGEWPPYFSEKLAHYGIGSRIVTESFALEGIRVMYGFFPWKRGLMLARRGDWDGAVGWQTNPEREAHFYASDTVWHAPWVFFHLKTTPFSWQALEDLAKVKIGGTLGYMYTPSFLAAERSGVIKVDWASSDNQGFRKLWNGRIDVFPQLIDVGNFQIREIFDPETAGEFTHHPTPFGIHSEQLLLARKIEGNRRLIEIFNRGLQRLKESGRYERYFDQLRKGP